MARNPDNQDNMTRINGLCFMAALEGNANNTAAYLRRGVSLEDFDRRGFLVMVAARGHVEVVRLLLDEGADINATMADGKVNALMSAAKAGHVAVVRLLLERGANIGTEEQSRCRTLRWAVQQDNTDILLLLLGAGIDVNERTTHGETALLTAVCRGCIEMVKALIAAGADVNCISQERMNALRAARLYNQQAILEILKQAGAQELELSAKERLRDTLASPVARLLRKFHSNVQASNR